jgi:hypothetical protein
MYSHEIDVEVKPLEATSNYILIFYSHTNIMEAQACEAGLGSSVTKPLPIMLPSINCYMN